MADDTSKPIPFPPLEPAPSPFPTPTSETTPILTPPNPKPTFSWLHFSTWSLSLRLLPAYIALLSIFIALYTNHYINTSRPTHSPKSPSLQQCRNTFNFTYRINAVRHQAKDLSTHSWELGTAAEAIEELIDPDKTVFAGVKAFPRGNIPKQGLKMDQALLWVYQSIETYKDVLFEDEESTAVSDPAALGVAAVMVGQKWKVYLEAAERQVKTILEKAPRWRNEPGGAVSHRAEREELWSDAVGMVPPFLAYYAVARNDVGLMREAVNQVEKYRDGLRTRSGSKKGLWSHVKSVDKARNDDGAWSTGNAWAAYGMARTRATISSWGGSANLLLEETKFLDAWTGEILDAAIRLDNDASGLLRNYLGDSASFGETSGTALLTATAYRMAVLNPQVFAQEKYLGWAHAKRKTLAARVSVDGLVGPAVNPLRHDSRETINNSPEGQSFMLMLGAAWRDCVCGGICSADA